MHDARSICVRCSVPPSASTAGADGRRRRDHAPMRPIPPYNIEKTGDDSYRLTMAVAGFGPEDIELTVKENTLHGRRPRRGRGAEGAEVLYRGIAGRAFERRFVLADHIVVEGADLQNGLLHVGLKRVVPEALKPRRIAVERRGAAARGGNDSSATRRRPLRRHKLRRGARRRGPGDPAPFLRAVSTGWRC